MGNSLAVFALVLVGPMGCVTSLDHTRFDAGARIADAAAPEPDAAVAPIDAGAELDASPEPTDTGTPPPPPLPPPLARPPAGPPDHASVVAGLAAERPDLFATSCVSMGGTYDFLFELVRRLRAIDVRYGLVMRGGVLLADRVGYYWGDGVAEGSSETYVLDVIARHCGVPGVDLPAAPGWLDDSAAGGTWTILPLTGVVPPPVDGGMPPPTMLPLPDGRPVVNAVAAERPDLLAGSCVADGGNNEFLFEVVRRLRAMDVRWGLNWKRGVVGDMSQDAITYYFAPGAPVESSTDVYIIDMIGGHCGPTPSAAFTDVTEATRLGGTIGRWTLAGRTDLGP